ncbi:MAG: hypothetical protein JRG93_09865 [Deltaproteobacteria bacterium]|nr:hypothetical protein [Deltaproteobacteria bacterium]
MAGVARGQVFDVSDHLYAVLRRVRHGVQATESREAPEETFTDDRIGVTPQPLAHALKAGHF